ncbi:MAG: carboxylate--amine ligase, partial [Acidobacteria bacterium]|nr:carboxylate--amine ligase [Acidobacteriota bacterium]
MRRVLLIAATTGYQTRAFDDSARRLGVELTLATDRCHVLEDPWGDRALAVRFEDPQLSAARIAGSARERKIDGILAVDDRQAILAASAAAALEIPYNPVAATAACHDKHRARELYRAAGLPVPSFFRVALEDDPEATAQRARYPCVLKPLALSASRGVIRANDPAEFLAAFRRIR